MISQSTCAIKMSHAFISQDQARSFFEFSRMCDSPEMPDIKGKLLERGIVYIDHVLQTDEEVEYGNSILAIDGHPECHKGTIMVRLFHLKGDHSDSSDLSAAAGELLQNFKTWYGTRYLKNSEKVGEEVTTG